MFLALALPCAIACARNPQAPQPAPPQDAPELRQHPGVAPDEIATRSDEATPSVQSDAGASNPAPPSEACKTHDTPPAPKTKKRTIRSGPPVTNHIPPELIMRPIRERAACFRFCYEQGLRSNRELSGRVELKFIIDEDGWVRHSSVWKTDLPDMSVANCLAQEFIGLSYPPPDGGATVTIIYPLTLATEAADGASPAAP